MKMYDGSRNVVFEHGYTTGYRCEMTLRRGEKLVRHWSNRGKHVNQDLGRSAPVKGVPGKGDMKYSPDYGDISPGRIGSGEHVYKPGLADRGLADAVLDMDNLAFKGGALRLVDSDKPGTLVIEMRAPYVCLAGAVSGALSGGSLDVRLSTNNGLDYAPVGNARGAAPFALDTSKAIFRRYAYRVKLELTGAGAGLTDLILKSEVQVSQRALPILTKGSNTVTVMAEPGRNTMTMEGKADSKEKRNETFASHHAGTEALMKDRSTLWIERQYSKPEDQRHGYVTFPVSAPGAIKGVRASGQFRARQKRAGVKLEASFDQGKTWKEFLNVPGPYSDFSTGGELKDVPQGKTEALVRYHLYGPEPTGVLAYRIDIDYDDGPAKGVRPFNVVYTWTEGGQEKQHKQLIAKTPFSYRISIAGKPVMKSVTIEMGD
jgi:hypothetical protein